MLVGGDLDGGVMESGVSGTQVLFLEFEGANGSTTFTDSSSFSRTPAVVGTGTTITTAQSAVGSSSGDFAGVDSVLQYADSTDFTASSDYDVECHVRATSFAAAEGGANRCIWSFGNLTNTQPGLIWGTNGSLLFFAGSTRITSSALSLNTFYKVRLSRSSGVYELFVDDVSQGTWSNSSTVNPSVLRIGASIANGTGNHEGQIDNFEFIVF